MQSLVICSVIILCISGSCYGLSCALNRAHCAGELESVLGVDSRAWRGTPPETTGSSAAPGVVLCTYSPRHCWCSDLQAHYWSESAKKDEWVTKCKGVWCTFMQENGVYDVEDYIVYVKECPLHFTAPDKLVSSMNRCNRQFLQLNSRVLELWKNVTSTAVALDRLWHDGLLFAIGSLLQDLHNADMDVGRGIGIVDATATCSGCAALDNVTAVVERYVCPSSTVRSVRGSVLDISSSKRTAVFASVLDLASCILSGMGQGRVPLVIAMLEEQYLCTDGAVQNHSPFVRELSGLVVQARTLMGSLPRLDLPSGMSCQDRYRCCFYVSSECCAAVLSSSGVQEACGPRIPQCLCNTTTSEAVFTCSGITQHLRQMGDVLEAMNSVLVQLDTAARRLSADLTELAFCTPAGLDTLLPSNVAYLEPLPVFNATARAGDETLLNNGVCELAASVFDVSFCVDVCWHPTSGGRRIEETLSQLEPPDLSLPAFSLDANSPWVPATLPVVEFSTVVDVSEISSDCDRVCVTAIQSVLSARKNDGTPYPVLEHYAAVITADEALIRNLTDALAYSIPTTEACSSDPGVVACSYNKMCPFGQMCDPYNYECVPDVGTNASLVKDGLPFSIPIAAVVDLSPGSVGAVLTLGAPQEVVVKVTSWKGASVSAVVSDPNVQVSTQPPVASDIAYDLPALDVSGAQRLLWVTIETPVVLVKGLGVGDYSIVSDGNSTVDSVNDGALSEQWGDDVFRDWWHGEQFTPDPAWASGLAAQAVADVSASVWPRIIATATSITDTGSAVGWFCLDNKDGFYTDSEYADGHDYPTQRQCSTRTFRSTDYPGWHTCPGMDALVTWVLEPYLASLEHMEPGTITDVVAEAALRSLVIATSFQLKINYQMSTAPSIGWVGDTWYGVGDGLRVYGNWITQFNITFPAIDGDSYYTSSFLNFGYNQGYASVSVYRHRIHWRILSLYLQSLVTHGDGCNANVVSGWIADADAPGWGVPYPQYVLYALATAGAMSVAADATMGSPHVREEGTTTGFSSGVYYKTIVDGVAGDRRYVASLMDRATQHLMDLAAYVPACTVEEILRAALFSVWDGLTAAIRDSQWQPVEYNCGFGEYKRKCPSFPYHIGARWVPLSDLFGSAGIDESVWLLNRVSEYVEMITLCTRSLERLINPSPFDIHLWIDAARNSPIGINGFGWNPSYERFSQLGEQRAGAISHVTDSVVERVARFIAPCVYLKYDDANTLDACPVQLPLVVVRRSIEACVAQRVNVTWARHSGFYSQNQMVDCLSGINLFVPFEHTDIDVFHVVDPITRDSYITDFPIGKIPGGSTSYSNWRPSEWNGVKSGVAWWVDEINALLSPAESNNMDAVAVFHLSDVLQLLRETFISGLANFYQGTPHPTEYVYKYLSDTLSSMIGPVRTQIQSAMTNAALLRNTVVSDVEQRRLAMQKDCDTGNIQWACVAYVYDGLNVMQQGFLSAEFSAEYVHQLSEQCISAIPWASLECDVQNRRLAVDKPNANVWPWFVFKLRSQHGCCPVRVNPSTSKACFKEGHCSALQRL